MLVFQISTVEWLNCWNLKDKLNCSHIGWGDAYLLQSVGNPFQPYNNYIERKMEDIFVFWKSSNGRNPQQSVSYQREKRGSIFIFYTAEGLVQFFMSHIVCHRIAVRFFSIFDQTLKVCPLMIWLKALIRLKGYPVLWRWEEAFIFLFLNDESQLF